MKKFPWIAGIGLVLLVGGCSSAPSPKKAEPTMASNQQILSASTSAFQTVKHEIATGNKPSQSDSDTLNQEWKALNNLHVNAPQGGVVQSTYESACAIVELERAMISDLGQGLHVPDSVSQELNTNLRKLNRDLSVYPK